MFSKHCALTQTYRTPDDSCSSRSLVGYTHDEWVIGRYTRIYIYIYETRAKRLDRDQQRVIYLYNTILTFSIVTTLNFNICTEIYEYTDLYTVDHLLGLLAVEWIDSTTLYSTRVIN